MRPPDRTPQLVTRLGHPLLVVVALVLGVAILLPGQSGAAAPGRHGAQLGSTGPVTVLQPLPVLRAPTVVTLRGANFQLTAEARLNLQEWSAAEGRWVRRATMPATNGRFAFTVQHDTATRVRYRTVLREGRLLLAVSDVVRLLVVAPYDPTCPGATGPESCPMPATIERERSVEEPYCPHLEVAVHRERRVIDWRWDVTGVRWVRVRGPWEVIPDSRTVRAAVAADCVKPVTAVPDGAALPDVRIKDLTKCGAGDLVATGGTCFMIVPSAPFNPDFPDLEGRKLLKFGVITMNVGSGPAQVIADRSGPSLSDWTAYQTFYDEAGHLLGSLLDPNLEFYFAGDGHQHWHVRDFDEYDLLDADGTTVARAEKHGYCMQDNTRYTPMIGQVGVPTAPVYADALACGKALPQALIVVHGLSRGWGDTYATSLGDQAIDITDVPDGEYVVRVHADARDAVRETDETNNVARVRIRISGDTVTVLPGTSSGGLT